MSESLLWTLQAKAYGQLGPEAWTKGLVPSYITSNPMIAWQYARLCCAYLRHFEEPVNILDIGAGAGRFGYLFLKAFLSMAPRCRFRFIMADAVQENLEFLQNHPALKKFDMIDFALYEHGQKEDDLIQKIKKGPLILLANYFFDTIEQDLFRIKKGRLEEGRISLHTSVEHPEWPADDPRWIPFLECRYDYVSFDPSRYPREVVEVLQGYTHLPDCTFLFPTGAVQTLEFFAKISNGKFLLLAGDQGLSTEAQIVRSGEPTLTKHSTFSIDVNYHGLAKYIEKRGGMALLTGFPDPVFANIAAVWGESELSEVEEEFNATLNRFEPKDYFLLVSELEGKLSLNALFLLLKLGDFDPANMLYFFPRILDQIKEASPQQREQWKGAVERVWEHLYIINKEEGEFVMNLGVLLYQMEFYEEALLFFQRSLEITGERKQTLKNIELIKRKICKEPPSQNRSF